MGFTTKRAQFWDETGTDPTIVVRLGLLSLDFCCGKNQNHWKSGEIFAGLMVLSASERPGTDYEQTKTPRILRLLLQTARPFFWQKVIW